VSTASIAASIRELEGRLRRPDRGENGYREGKEARSRIDTVKRLRELADEDKVERGGRAGGINTHVHTAKSFAYFDSPADAAWQAFKEQVAVFGINDHYTLAGHDEFGKACKALSIKPLFSMEAIAMWEEAERERATVNDPANPGRTYLTAKGITRAFPEGAAGAKDLATMNAALLERNKAITAKLAGLFEKRLKAKGAVTWGDVLALTPHGQPTERHICLLAATFLEKAYPDSDARQKAVARLVDGDVPAEALADAASFQDFLRAQLVKSGKPAYVEESKAAFIPIERLVSLALDLGAIPTYPVMGDPVSPWEEDLDQLFDRLERLNVHSVEVIPNRNTRERLAAIVVKAAERGFPILNGTEHNTKTPMPLVDKFFFDDELRPHFERGARIVLAHQALRAAGKEGFVREDGTLPPGDRAEHLKRIEEAGRRR